MTSLAIAAVALLAALMALAAAFLLRSGLKSAHQRIHDLERAKQDFERQFASLSRAASRAQAHSGGYPRELEAVCHAQHGEEFFLWEIFGFKSSGTFVEIGAYDGVSLSNSLFFEQLGWRGLLVEAHPELAERCKTARPAATVVHAALGATDGGAASFSMVRGEHGLDTLSFLGTNDQHRQRILSKKGVIEQVSVAIRSLRSLLAEADITSVDWMSVDVEGGELDVLKGAGLDSIRPKVIVVEDNSRGHDYQVMRYLASFGYKRVQTVGCNDFYRFDG
jgi:FkbM family methyltransferase